MREVVHLDYKAGGERELTPPHPEGTEQMLPPLTPGLRLTPHGGGVWQVSNRLHALSRGREGPG
jgi:hypothetical protein